ncbi:hypothetical protein [Streptomyces sp. NPDC004230]
MVAAISALVGLCLTVLGVASAFVRFLFTVAWVSSAVMAVAVLLTSACLLITALRNSASIDMARMTN